MRLLTIAGMVVLMLVAVSPEASGGGGTPITSCGQVVTTNAFLTQDLSCPGSDGVVVGASGITIDLKGFTLRGDRTGGTTGVLDIPGYDKVIAPVGTNIAHGNDDPAECSPTFLC
jgi:hypothetical protein